MERLATSSWAGPDSKPAFRRVFCDSEWWHCDTVMTRYMPHEGDEIDLDLWMKGEEVKPGLFMMEWEWWESRHSTGGGKYVHMFICMEVER